MRTSKKKSEDQFPIVGIGASAGGLAALKTFFSHVPEDSGLAYVVVVHLSPAHKSHLAELLQPHVKMPVQQVSETVKLERNHVYVIPPNANLDTIDTHLRLSDLEKRRQERAPIDHFFRTLAKTHDGDAIGVILTGTGSDGTLGLREIKEAGGPCLVQDPAEAEYSGMPQSAIATGIVDLVLPVARIPQAILRIIRTKPRLPPVKDGEEPEEDARRLLQNVLAQIRARTGRDFSRYKRSTIIRRIHRRMQIRHLEEMGDYLELLHSEPDEVRTLGDDLLIIVTGFFRDPEVFEKLEREVIPTLFEGKVAEEEIRVWAVGCATGEEAYSLAILLYEEVARREISPRIQIFASDLHEHSLRKAREGIFPGDIETDVSPERLKRFFVKENGGYRIRKELREMVVFAPHNLLGDPPFSRLDLVSCRNLLIYIEREVQHDIVELFHYALKAEGYLVVGPAETVDTSDLFRVVDKQRSIYQKRNVPVPEPQLPVFPLTYSRLPRNQEQRQHAGGPIAYGALHQRMIERYAFPSALVSPDDRVVHLSEHAGRYLFPPGGEPTVNIFRLVRKELQIELRTALHTARKKREAVDSRPVQVRFDGETAFVTVHVRPSHEPHQDGFALVIFEEQKMVESPPPVGRSAAPETPTKGAAAKSSVPELEAELEQTRQRLQAIIEEYETSQEEMKASNEEMQSTNEELRSTMEELETSKEELQSMNEELQTVNQENRHKVEELSQLSDDLQNLLGATDIATLFLDRDLRILRFTTKVSELFNVRMTDRGRPLSDLTHRLGYDQLHKDAARVLETLVPADREVEDDSGRRYLTRVMPYRTTEHRIDGVVITFIDITNRKQAEQEVAKAKEYAESIVETLHEPLLVLNPDLTVRSCNQAFYENFQVRPDQTVGRLIYKLGNGQWDIPSLRELLENVLPTNEVFNDYEVRHHFENLGERVMLLNGRRLDHGQLILLGIRDITERKRAEDALRASEERMQRMINVRGVGVLMFKEDGILIDANDSMLEMIGYSREEVQSGQLSWQTMTPPEWVEISKQQLQQLEETGNIGPYEKEYVHKDGSRSWMLFAGARLGDGTIVKYCIEIGDRKRAEMKIREHEQRFRTLVEQIQDYAIFMVDMDGRATTWNEGVRRVLGFDEAEFLGHDIAAAIFTPEDVAAGVPQAELEEAAETGSSNNDRWMMRKDGTRFWASGITTALRDEQGQLLVVHFTNGCRVAIMGFEGTFPGKLFAEGVGPCVDRNCIISLSFRRRSWSRPAIFRSGGACRIRRGSGPDWWSCWTRIRPAPIPPPPARWACMRTPSASGGSGGRRGISRWTTSRGADANARTRRFDEAQARRIACESMEGSDQPVRRQSVDFVTQRVREQLDCPVSRSTIWRWLDEAAIKPWRYRHWIFPRDDQFAEKAGPILDLYAGRWKRQPLGENEFVLSADEKTSLQARRRTHPGQPPAPGRPARIEHEYERQGALQYLAAWDVHRGWVHGRCELHSGIDPFMRLVEQVMSTEPYASAERVFWIVDNGSSHRGQASIDRLQTAWPNARLLHASWLNQIEISFSILQRHVLTPNTFGDLQELARCLHDYAALSNANPEPFDWNFTRSKLRRYLQRLNHRPAA